jgi:hypothetical protein
MASNRISRVAAAFGGAAVAPPNASEQNNIARVKTRMEVFRQSECQDYRFALCAGNQRVIILTPWHSSGFDDAY